MNNIEQYKQRFYNLMESNMGDVRPIISEQPVRPVNPTAGQQPPMAGKKPTTPGQQPPMAGQKPAPTKPNTPTGQQPQQVQQASQEQMDKIKPTNDKFKAELGRAINNYFNGCVAILGKEKCTAGLNDFRAETLGSLEQKL